MATPVEVNQAGEKWNEYLLEDGTVLKMKLVLKKVLKVDGEFDPEGNPVYVMQSTNVTAVNAPGNLKKPGVDPTAES
jgi:cytoskeletal protein CcmA (bactofilin family)